jgi:nucleoside-diphosphate-sugar epimerase
MATRPEAIGQVFYLASGDPIDWSAVQDLMARVVFNRKKPLRTLALSPKSALIFAGLMEFFGKLMGKTPFLNKSKAVEGGGSGMAVSSEKAKKLLGWQPRQTVESTLQNAAKWYVDHGWL